MGKSGKMSVGKRVAGGTLAERRGAQMERIVAKAGKKRAGNGWRRMKPQSITVLSD